MPRADPVAPILFARPTRSWLRGWLQSRRALPASGVTETTVRFALHAIAQRRGVDGLLRLAEHETDAKVDDEAAVREAWLLRIAAAVVRALDLSPSLVMEEQMLAVRASNGGGRAQPPPREMPALAQGVAQAAAALARSDRERLRAGVFRPSHILPTMTIEQFGARLANHCFGLCDSWLIPALSLMCFR